ncbi:MAG TPA: Gfo/Idh/MocA family oxidoreductase [Dehalococcoidia bacterium]|jgi:phthalate 4,5-cis-dihydrodiol dehydrogenase|nr:Gfo/Idh/MocA family oxidoreductase [Chloroflexota bacterium]HIB11981.1 Gfo/Idh/MocA family oxidoreductase [Dehalococcoidia bacterium]|tara:strand:- start:469 stop:1692 length:1224 start_codon:yes stop_codon:yes gene_type:complete
MTSSGGSANGPVLNLGIIGLGGGASQMLPAFARHSRVSVTAAADIDQDQLDKFRTQYEGETFLSAEAICRSPSVDVVYIATPNQFHSEHALIALENKKHVYMEKPMTLTLEEADVMIQAAERNGMQLAVNVKHSFEPRVRKIREMVVNEELGKLRMLNYWYFNDWLYSPRTAEELTPELGGGVPWRQGPHQFDILRTIAGGLVRTVRATTGVWDETRPVPGCYSSFLEFENGVVATAVYSGYDHFSSRELTYRVDEGDAWPDPPVHAKARTALREAGSKEAETAMKRDRRFGGTGRDPAGASPGQRRPTPWILGGPLVASFDKGDVRLTPNGLMVYGEEEKREIPLPSLPDGRDGIIDEVYQAVINGRRPSNDGHWGKATLEVLLALFQSGKERREIQMSHQVPTQD